MPKLSFPLWCHALLPNQYGNLFSDISDFCNLQFKYFEFSRVNMPIFPLVVPMGCAHHSTTSTEKCDRFSTSCPTTIWGQLLFRLRAAWSRWTPIQHPKPMWTALLVMMTSWRWPYSHQPFPEPHQLPQRESSSGNYFQEAQSSNVLSASLELGSCFTS